MKEFSRWWLQLEYGEAYEGAVLMEGQRMVIEKEEPLGDLVIVDGS